MANEKANKVSWLTWLILAALGVLVIVGRNAFKDALYIILGIGLILAAVVAIIGWWRSKNRSVEAIAGLLGHVVIGGIGVWILLHPGTFDAVVNVIIGAVLIIMGLIWLVRGFRLGRDVVIIALSIISIVLGFVIALNQAATSWVVIMEGIGLIYTAVVGFITEMKLR